MLFPSLCSLPRLWDTGPKLPPPAAARRRGQTALGPPRPSCGRESAPQASLTLFPLPRSRPDPLAAGIGTAGEPSPPPLFPSARGGRGQGILPITPWPFLYLLKNPSTF